MYYVYTHKTSGEKYLFTARRHEFYVHNLKRKLTETYEIEPFADRASAAKAAGQQES